MQSVMRCCVARDTDMQRWLLAQQTRKTLWSEMVISKILLGNLNLD
jgi:hypothetical protein